MSISVSSGGKYSQSSRSIEASSSSSLLSVEVLSLSSSPKITPMLITSCSSMGSSVSKSEKLEKMHSAAGSPHLKHGMKEDLN